MSRAFPALPSLRPFQPTQILRRLAEVGFVHGQLADRPVTIPVDLDQTVSLLDRSAVGLNPVLLECARAILQLFGVARVEPDLTRLDSGVHLGPAQLELYKRLYRAVPNIQVVSGFRTPDYQALLFAQRLLGGQLLDRFNRLYSLPPLFSDHVVPDFAIDFIQPATAPFRAAQLEFPFSVCLPYLSSSVVAFEPWHWRLLQISPLTPSKPRPMDDISKITTKYYQALHSDVADGLEQVLTGQNTPAREKEETHWLGQFAFAASLKDGNVVSCIGSKQRSLATSMVDSINAIADPWDCVHVTIPMGFTPLSERGIEEADLGFQCWRIATPTPAFITGAATCWDRLHTTEAVHKALINKAGHAYCAEAPISKSIVVEALIIKVEREHVVLPSSYGLPNHISERPEEVPLLISHDYLQWLMASRNSLLPAYQISNYIPSSHTYYDEVRYALLLRYLIEWRSLLPFPAFELEGSLRKILVARASKSDFDHRALVFLCYALAQEDRNSRAYLTLRGNLFESLKDSINRLSDIDFGHLAAYCHLDAQVTGTTSSLTRRVTMRSLQVVERWNLSKDNVLALAQTISLVSVTDFARGLELADAFVSDILSWPVGGTDSEVGAVLNAENFLTGLFAEALTYLKVAGLIPHHLDSQARQRTLDALCFCRRLQFASGSSAFAGLPGALDGGVRFSLLDHSSRFDYGAHVCNAALRFFCEWQ